MVCQPERNKGIRQDIAPDMARGITPGMTRERKKVIALDIFMVD